MNAFARPEVAILFSCPECGGELRKRSRRYDSREFYGCASFPDCTWTAPAYAEATALAEKVAELEAERQRLAALLDRARGVA